jgi:hypothetical protein
VPASFWCLGIDPGSKGAIVALRSDLSDLRMLRMPMLSKEIDTREVCAFIKAVRLDGDVRHAVIEKAQVMPSQGAVSGFTYGAGYGSLKTILEMMDIPFEETPPAKWKLAVIGASARLPARGSKESPSVRKRRIKEIAILAARRLFPAAKFMKTQDGLAEAALMAEASRRKVLHGTMLMG